MSIACNTARTVLQTRFRILLMSDVVRLCLWVWLPDKLGMYNFQTNIYIEYKPAQNFSISPVFWLFAIPARTHPKNLRR